MELRNAMEDIVDEYLEMLLKTYKNICKCNRCQLDMKAYTLNRIQPKYIVSERGLIHLTLNGEREVQKQADIIEVVDRGIKLVSKRIRENYSHKDRFMPHKTVDIVEGFYYNFPNFVGSVFLGQKLDIISGIKITLFEGDKDCEPRGYEPRITEMIDEGWKNPYITNEATRGYYNFWVKPRRAEDDSENAKLFSFKFKFEYKNYPVIEKGIKVRVFSEDRLYTYIRKNFVRRISPIFLEGKK